MKNNKAKIEFNNLIMLYFSDTVPPDYTLISTIFKPSYIGFFKALELINPLKKSDIDNALILYKIDDKELIALNNMLRMIIFSHSFSNSFINSYLSKVALAKNDSIFSYFEGLTKEELEKTTFPERFEILDVLGKNLNMINKNDGFYKSYFGVESLKNYIYKAYNTIIFNYSRMQIKVIESQSEIEIAHQLFSLEKQFNIENKEIELLRTAIFLIDSGDKNKLTSIYNSLRNDTIHIDPKVLYNLFVCLINVAFKNQEKWKWNWSDILDLYKFQITGYESIFVDEAMPQDIKNICTLSIRTGHIDWFLELFNPKFISRFNIECRNSIKLCFIKIEFSNNEYHKCIESLNFFKTSSIFQELELRRLQVMCFYELGERVLVDNYLNTFKVFIHRNDTINTNYKESNNNFIRLLIRLNKSVDYKKTEVILNDYSKMDRISEKQWVNDKITQLLQKLNEEIN